MKFWQWALVGAAIAWPLLMVGGWIAKSEFFYPQLWFGASSQDVKQHLASRYLRRNRRFDIASTRDQVGSSFLKALNKPHDAARQPDLLPHAWICGCFFMSLAIWI